MKPWVKRGLAIGLAVAVIGGTFVFVLPQFANYSEVWDQVQTLSWEWVAVLLAAVVLNLATFGPPWMTALPGLGYWSAETVTQASTASTYIAPGGPAVGIGISAAMLLGWGFHADEVALAVTLTGIWNQLAILGLPAVAFALLTLTGGDAAALQTIATIGLAVFVVVAGAFGLALASRKMARRVGDLAARVLNRVLGLVRRGPVGWSGESLARFRGRAIGLLGRRWHLLTLADARGPADRVPGAARLPARPRGGGGRGDPDRGVRGLVAGPRARLDPDHARRARACRARPDLRAGGVRRQPRRRRRLGAGVPLPHDRADAPVRSHRGRDLAAAPPQEPRRSG